MTELHNGMAVEISGEGEALLCIHGLGGTSNIWTPVMGALSGFRVIRPDLPGSGRSPLPDGVLSIAFYVERMKQLLDDLSVSQVHLVAHSMGTIIAMHLTAQYPGLVKSLALFGPLLSPPDTGRAAIQERSRAAISGGLSAMQKIADTIVTGALSAETHASNPAVVALVRECVMRQTPEGYGASCGALAEAQPADIRKITAPVMLITGNEDAVGSPEKMHEFAKDLSNCRETVLTDCGHWTTFEKPEECADRLMHFYQDLKISP